MVHLPQEWNFGSPTTLPSLAIPPSPLTATHGVIFPLICDVTRSIYVRIKSLVRVLRALPCFGLIIRMYIMLKVKVCYGGQDHSSPKVCFEEPGSWLGFTVLWICGRKQTLFCCVFWMLYRTSVEGGAHARCVDVSGIHAAPISLAIQFCAIALQRW